MQILASLIKCCFEQQQKQGQTRKSRMLAIIIPACLRILLFNLSLGLFLTHDLHDDISNLARDPETRQPEG